MLERHAERLARCGYTVFRGLVPPLLLAELRRMTDWAGLCSRSPSR
jgi:hypothetical protein